MVNGKRYIALTVGNGGVFLRGQARTHGRRMRRGDQGLAHDGRRRPSGPHLGWRRLLLRRLTSGARATAIGRCGPFLLWAGI
jgi:hypothetical protein